AIVWSERGLAAVASDAGLAGTREAAHDALWQAYELSATALLQRQDFGGARQLLREALDDPAVPAVRAAGFRGLFSSTFAAGGGRAHGARNAREEGGAGGGGPRVPKEGRGGAGGVPGRRAPAAPPRRGRSAALVGLRGAREPPA